MPNSTKGSAKKRTASAKKAAEEAEDEVEDEVEVEVEVEDEATPARSHASHWPSRRSSPGRTRRSRCCLLRIVRAEEIVL